MKTYDKNLNKQIFGVNFLSDYSEEQVEQLTKLVEEQIRDLGDEVVFQEWTDYLKDFVNDKKEAENFTYAFFNFGGHDLKVKDPYYFLGLLFLKNDISLFDEPKTESDQQLVDLIDSIYVSLLTNAKIIGDDDYFYLKFSEDKKLIKTIEDLK